MLDVLITSRVRRKLVIVFARYPDFRAHVRGIAKLIKEDAGNIQRELKNLHDAGFIDVVQEGNTKVYSANPDFHLYDELRSIVEKTAKKPA